MPAERKILTIRPWRHLDLNALPDTVPGADLPGHLCVELLQSTTSQSPARFCRARHLSIQSFKS